MRTAHDQPAEGQQRTIEAAGRPAARSHSLKLESAEPAASALHATGGAQGAAEQGAGRNRSGVVRLRVGAAARAAVLPSRKGERPKASGLTAGVIGRGNHVSPEPPPLR